ncbi:FISUMP domain-containing protein [Fibrobacter sp. UWH3]|uniref:FISUMP domain-containing protein n=1 Tax=Fibrobacter sp. UWH3 TaxID=1964353 RepID=UPI000B51F46F|nr:FISUMP domain-containing protein [Fibrobacter sp. UWH3]OWV07206.1 hypothetical protein B7993_03045 [Fibrobacter sp. UWH3]
MKFSLGMILAFCWTFLFFAACSDSEKKVANGYTEEQNATNLDSAAYALLMTWEPASPVALRKVNNAEFGKSWYEIQFTTAGNSYYKHTGKTVEDACTVDLYTEQNGVRMNLTRVYKKDAHTEFLSRDSLDAVVEDHLNNTYEGDSAVANCQADSTAFVDYCSENDGIVTDLFKLDKCTILHLICVVKFKPKVTANEYLQGTAKKMKDRCIAEFYAPEDPEDEEPAEVASTLFVDERDGHVYKTVKIGDQTWMAENLNYAYLVSTETLDSLSYCPGGDPANCEKFGRLYSWSAAVDSADVFGKGVKDCGGMDICNPGRNIQGICPDGWRIPNLDDFEILEEEMGGKDVAGERATTEEMFGTDDYGFSALPAGGLYNPAYSSDAGSFGAVATFIMTTEYDWNAWVWLLVKERSWSQFMQTQKSAFMSLRCIMGTATEFANYVVDPATVVTGSLTDSRDDHVYKIATIGSQTWMADNLKYKGASTSYCYDNEESNCEKYGRMYSQSESRTICPEGWHLPTAEDYEDLYAHTGKTASSLKSAEGWSSVYYKSLTDPYSFNLYPTGSVTVKTDGSLKFQSLELDACLWTSSEKESTSGEIEYLIYTVHSGSYEMASNDYANVRCLKD